MTDSISDLGELATLWPKLPTAFRMLRHLDRRSGIFFISDDEQGLLAARKVAGLLGGKLLELPEEPVKKAEFHQTVGRFLDGEVLDSVANEAGMNRLCLVIPRIDKQPKWLHGRILHWCEQSRYPFTFLMTCPALDWMSKSMNGYFYDCRKKGATVRSRKIDPGKAFEPPRKKSGPSQENLFD